MPTLDMLYILFFIYQLSSVALYSISTEAARAEAAVEAEAVALPFPFKASPSRETCFDEARVLVLLQLSPPLLQQQHKNWLPRQGGLKALAKTGHLQTALSLSLCLSLSHLLTHALSFSISFPHACRKRTY